MTKDEVKDERKQAEGDPTDQKQAASEDDGRDACGAC
jgi:flagellar biosynthesis protein FlhB